MLSKLKLLGFNFGKSMESWGRKLVREEEVSFYPQQAYILVDSFEHQAPMNSLALKKLNLSELLPSIEDRDVKREAEIQNIPAFAKNLLESVFVADNVEVGADVELKKGCTIWYGAQVGNNVKFSENVHVLDNAVIGSGVRIGSGVTILPGVKVDDNLNIPDGVFIEAGVHVTKETKLSPNTYVGFKEIASKGSMKQIQIRDPLAPAVAKSRETMFRDFVSDTAFLFHKRESERPLGELLKLREAIENNEVKVADVMKIGSASELETKRVQRFKTKYEIPQPERGLFYTHRVG